MLSEPWNGIGFVVSGFSMSSGSCCSTTVFPDDCEEDNDLER